MNIDDICFIDIETSGLYPHRHGICQIGAVLGERMFFCNARLDVGDGYDAGALIVNGETIKSIHDKNRQGIAEALDTLRDFVMDFVMSRPAPYNPVIAAGHNPAFDLGFIRQKCEIHQIDYMFSHRSIDTHTMFVDRFGYSCNMDSAREKVGLPAEEKPHNALNGAMCARELYIKLKGLPCIQQ